MKYKVGDTIRIVKPEGTEYDIEHGDSTSDMWNAWTDLMDSRIGTVHELHRLTRSGWRINGVPFGWLEDWLEPVETATDKFDDAMKIL